MQNTYNITFSINRAHLLFAMVTLYSLLKNNQKYYFDIYILHNNCLKQEEIEDICNKFPLNQFDNFKIHLIDVSKIQIIKNLQDPNTLHQSWTKEIYFKLFLPELLPNIDKILHLDTDVLVIGDIQDFIETNMDNSLFLGGEDYFSEVCVGVMLINLADLKKTNILEDFNKELMFNNKITEQQFINKFYKNKIIMTPKNYIYTTGYKENIKDNSTKIIHFTNIKPYILSGFKIKDFKLKGISEYFTYLEDFIEIKSKWRFKLLKFYVLLYLGTINSLKRRIIRFYYKYILIKKDFYFNPKTKEIYKYSIIKKQ